MVQTHKASVAVVATHAQQGLLLRVLSLRSRSRRRRRVSRFAVPAAAVAATDSEGSAERGELRCTSTANI